MLCTDPVFMCFYLSGWLNCGAQSFSAACIWANPPTPLGVQEACDSFSLLWFPHPPPLPAAIWGMSLRPNLQPSLTKNSIESNFESDLTFSTFSRPIFDDFGCPNPPKMNGIFVSLLTSDSKSMLLQKLE